MPAPLKPPPAHEHMAVQHGGGSLGGHASATPPIRMTTTTCGERDGSSLDLGHLMCGSTQFIRFELVENSFYPNFGTETISKLVAGHQN